MGDIIRRFSIGLMLIAIGSTPLLAQTIGGNVNATFGQKDLGGGKGGQFSGYSQALIEFYAGKGPITGKIQLDLLGNTDGGGGGGAPAADQRHSVTWSPAKQVEIEITNRSFGLEATQGVSRIAAFHLGDNFDMDAALHDDNRTLVPGANPFGNMDARGFLRVGYKMDKTINLGAAILDSTENPFEFGGGGTVYDTYVPYFMGTFGEIGINVGYVKAKDDAVVANEAKATVLGVTFKNKEMSLGVDYTKIIINDVPFIKQGLGVTFGEIGIRYASSDITASGNSDKNIQFQYVKNVGKGEWGAGYSSYETGVTGANPQSFIYLGIKANL